LLIYLKLKVRELLPNAYGYVSVCPHICGLCTKGQRKLPRRGMLKPYITTLLHVRHEETLWVQKRFVINGLSNGSFFTSEKNGQNVLTVLVQGVDLELKMLLLQKWWEFIGLNYNVNFDGYGEEI